MKEKLTIKNLVLVAACSVLGAALMYLLPMPFLFTPYTILISPIFQALFMAIPFFIVGTKVNKKWALFIYCTIWGIAGIMPYYIVGMVIAGLLVEFICNNENKNLFERLRNGYVIAMLMHYICGTIIPYFLTKGAEFEMIKEMYGLVYATKMQSLKTIPFMMMVALGVVVVSMVGSLIAKRMLRKYFM